MFQNHFSFVVKLLVGLKWKILKIVCKSTEQIPVRILQCFSQYVTDSLRLFRFTKSTIIYVFIVPLTNNHQKIEKYIFFRSGILLQQPIALLKVCCTILQCKENERTWEIKPSWVDVTTAAGSLLQNWGYNQIQECFCRSILKKYFK